MRIVSKLPKPVQYWVGYAIGIKRRFRVPNDWTFGFTVKGVFVGIQKVPAPTPKVEPVEKEVTRKDIQANLMKANVTAVDLDFK